MYIQQNNINLTIIALMINREQKCSVREKIEQRKYIIQVGG